MEVLHTLSPGTRLNNEFEIIRLLGSGGFANTYLAYDGTLDREVAVKEFFPGDIAVRASAHTVRARSEEHQPGFDWGLERFEREARTLAKFKHPNIVRVFRTFRANETAYIVLDFVKGADMDVWLKEINRRPSQAELDHLLERTLEALELVHNAGILHRDIKPSNIYIREDGSPVLLDFGAARATFGQMTGRTAAIVSRGYSPHESYSTDAKLQGPWTDIYGLAATIHRALTGEVPPDAASRVLEDSLVPAAQLPLPAGAYRPSFLAALDHGLAVIPSERPRSIGAWRPGLLGLTAVDRAEAAKGQAAARPAAAAGRPASRSPSGQWRPISQRPSTPATGQTRLPSGQTGPAVSRPLSQPLSRPVSQSPKSTRVASAVVQPVSRPISAPVPRSVARSIPGAAPVRNPWPMRAGLGLLLVSGGVIAAAQTGMLTTPKGGLVPVKPAVARIEQKSEAGGEQSGSSATKAPISTEPSSRPQLPVPSRLEADRTPPKEPEARKDEPRKEEPKKVEPKKPEPKKEARVPPEESEPESKPAPKAPVQRRQSSQSDEDSKPTPRPTPVPRQSSSSSGRSESPSYSGNSGSSSSSSGGSVFRPGR